MNNQEDVIPVKCVQDDSCHWYIIPNHLLDDFYKDLEDFNFVENGDFDDKYSQYRTGGSLNIVQLYIKK